MNDEWIELKHFYKDNNIPYLPELIDGVAKKRVFGVLENTRPGRRQKRKVCRLLITDIRVTKDKNRNQSNSRCPNHRLYPS